MQKVQTKEMFSVVSNMAPRLDSWLVSVEGGEVILTDSLLTMNLETGIHTAKRFNLTQHLREIIQEVHLTVS